VLQTESGLLFLYSSPCVPIRRIADSKNLIDFELNWTSSNRGSRSSLMTFPMMMSGQFQIDASEMDHETKPEHILRLQITRQMQLCDVSKSDICRGALSGQRIGAGSRLVLSVVHETGVGQCPRVKGHRNIRHVAVSRLIRSVELLHWQVAGFGL